MLHTHDLADEHANISRYWDDFYGTRTDIPDAASSFAHWVADRLGGIDLLVEFGCGTGRDAIWFADFNAQFVVATDASQAALNQLESRAATLSLSNLTTLKTDLVHPRSLTELADAIAQVRNRFDSPVKKVFYSRFLLHAITEVAQQNLITFIASQFRPGDIFVTEYRAAKLESDEYVFGTHYRRPVDPDQLAQMCRSSRFTRVDTCLSKDFAVHQTERPLVGRTIVGR